jgi:hypothetical protein
MADRYLTEDDDDKIWEGSPDPETRTQYALGDAILDWLNDQGEACDAPRVHAFGRQT